MSAEPNIEQLYEQQIKLLPRGAKLRLLARIADDLAETEDLRQAPSALDLLAQAPGGRVFTTASEVKTYLAQERAAWDR